MKKNFAKFSKYFLLYALTPLICLAFFALIYLSGGGNIFTLRALAVEYSARGLARRLMIFSEQNADNTPEESAVFAFAPSPGEISAPVQTERSLEIKTEIPEGSKPIYRRDMSGGSLFINTTKYTLDPDALRESSRIYPAADSPTVLVVHTHGTEAFHAPDGYFDPDSGADGFYDPKTESPRSKNRSENVIGVGDEFCKVLEQNGIQTLHCDVLHDEGDFNSSYSRSYASVTEYLKKYPSIKYVIDIHRDSIVRDNGDKIKPYTVIDGKPCAQVMLVMGTDQAYSHPNWRVNMGNALLYKDTMDALYPTLSRSIYVRTARFNQQTLTGAMLLEIGSCGNTFEEAENAAHYAALSLAALIRSAE